MAHCPTFFTMKKIRKIKGVYLGQEETFFTPIGGQREMKHRVENIL